ncbi:hypothetical protein AN958_10687 [Leucoagaricus sp. SymC.cos]|nr:hypothetical protein AN958_10687 [Leucoagaricus sp. SymC.cos]
MIFSYLTNLFLNLVLSSSAPLDPSPTGACLTSSRTLGALVDCFEEYIVLKDFYDQYTYLEAQPTEAQRKDWSTAVSTLLHTNNNCSSAIVPPTLQDIYTATSFTDADSGQSFCVLYEHTINTCSKFFEKGWGYMIVPASQDAVSRHIHIAGPHPLFDGETSAEAAQLFQETGAKSLLVPGRIRTSYRAPSTCVMGTTTTVYYMTDPAHNDLEPFFDANVAIWEWQTQHGGCPSESCAFIQLHGKAETSCVSDTIFLSTGLGTNNSWYTDGADRPIKRLKEQLSLSFNPEPNTTPLAISLPSDSHCILTATKNVVGRYLNNLPPPASHNVCTHVADAGSTKGVFIHAEQSGLARSEASRAAWISALKNTFAEVNAQ